MCSDSFVKMPRQIFLDSISFFRTNTGMGIIEKGRNICALKIPQKIKRKRGQKQLMLWDG